MDENAIDNSSESNYNKPRCDSREFMFTIAKMQNNASARRAEMQMSSDKFYTILTQNINGNLTCSAKTARNNFAKMAGARKARAAFCW